MLEKAEGKIETLVEMTEKPMLLEKITFGKYKGKSFEEMFDKIPLDFVWMYVNMAPTWPDLDFTLTHWLKQKEFFWKKAQQERKETEILRY